MLHARKRGFSLIEVLLSLALISGASILLLKQQVELARAVREVHVI
jgi:prepilin-type N-terminal cleavage/methylation domain-containing protein